MPQPSLRILTLVLLVALLAACDRSRNRSTPQNPNPTPPVTPAQFTVTAVASAGGAIAPESTTLEEGDTTSFTVAADEGFSIGPVSGCGGNLDGDVYTTGAVTADCTVEATFVIDTYTVTATAGDGGSVDPAEQVVEHGSVATVEVTAETGFRIDSVEGCEGSISGSTYSTGPVTADCAITASFAIETYSVTTVVSDGGSLDPPEQVVDHGTVAVFEVVVEPGFRTESVSGCDGSLDVNVYTTGAVTNDCAVTAEFALLVLTAPENVMAEPGVGQVTLSWDAVEDALAYNIYFGTEADIDIATAASYDDLLLGVQSPHIVEGLSNGTEHHFVVTAAAGPVESPASAEVAATPFDGVIASYFGTDGNDFRPTSILVHPINGDVYVLGGTSGGDAPVTDGAWITDPLACGPLGANGCFNALARFTPDLRELVAATYLPSGGTGGLTSMVIDPVSGDIFIAGSGSVSGAGLRDENGEPVIDPDTGSAYLPYQASSGGNADAVLLRLNANLSARLAATNYGGPGFEFFRSIAISPIDGDIYVLGFQFGSFGTPGPGIAGGVQETYGGDSNDLLIARFSPQLHDLRQATYLGGNSTDWGAGNYDSIPAIVVHPDTGDVYVVNGTAATNFPTTPGALQEAVPGDSTNGVVARLSADLTTLLSSTYFGGDGSWIVTSIAVDADGDILIAGRANRPTLPGSEGGAQSSIPLGPATGFVSRLAPDLTSVRQSSYYAPLNIPSGTVQAIKALQVHPVSGEIYVVGEATAPAELPGIEGALLESTTGTGSNAFLARFSPDLTEILQTSLVSRMTRLPTSIWLDPDTMQVYTVVASGDASFVTAQEGAFPTNPGGASWLITRMLETLAR